MSSGPHTQNGGYSVGAVVRLTGLSEHLLRAWERRYAAVVPRRTPGGSRRYSESDVERLKLLQAGVAAGHPISEIAGLTNEEIARRVRAVHPPERPPLDEALAALTRLDARGLEQLLSVQFAALGPTGFARRVAQPLLEEVGRRWQKGELSVAAEHMASSVMRTLLGVALRSQPAAPRPPLVFATPSGERHEFGVLIAALVALGAGAEVVYLGPDLPADEVARAARGMRAGGVVLGLVVLEEERSEAFLQELRAALPGHVDVWIGGAASAGLRLPDGVERLPDFDAVERRIHERWQPMRPGI